ncbi:MAG: hypothetical protein R3F11_30190 [Verrucomicrobiales bacterium]
MSFVEGMNSDSIDERFVHQVIYSVAIKDPNGAKVWVPQQAAKLDRPELVGDLVKIFLQTDSIAASEWVTNYQLGRKEIMPCARLLISRQGREIWRGFGHGCP